MSRYMVDQVFDENQKIMGKLELEDIVRRQIDRCNTSATDPFLFSRNVEMLMNLLPSGRLKEIQDRKGEYVDEVERWKFEYWGSIPLGTIEKPYYVNTPDSPYWDGGEPILKSPIRIKEFITNYEKLYTLVLQMLESVGLTWRMQVVEIEGGEVDFNESPDLENPKPTYGNKPKGWWKFEDDKK